MKKLICIILALLPLFASCSAPAPQSTQASTLPQTKEEPVIDLSNLTLFADSWDVSTDSSADLSKTSLVFDAYKDHLSGDTVFSGTIIKAIRL